MDVKFREEDDRLVVDVTIDERKKASDPHRVVGTKQILDIAKDRGYNVGNYTVEAESACSTEGKNPTLSSTWVLRKVKNEQPNKSTKQPKQPRRTRSTRTRKTTTPKKNKLLRTEDMGGVQSQAQTDLPGSDQEISGQ